MTNTCFRDEHLEDWMSVSAEHMAAGTSEKINVQKEGK